MSELNPNISSDELLNISVYHPITISFVFTKLDLKFCFSRYRSGVRFRSCFITCRTRFSSFSFMLSTVCYTSAFSMFV